MMTETASSTKGKKKKNEWNRIQKMQSCSFSEEKKSEEKKKKKIFFFLSKNFSLSFSFECSSCRILPFKTPPSVADPGWQFFAMSLIMPQVPLLFSLCINLFLLQKLISLFFSSGSCGV